jgi:2-polyprenyl-6-hydroxyphenyl methylase/3-demethylubiquinone-9 3-methyltransferase
MGATAETDREKFYDQMSEQHSWDDWTNPYETQRRIDLVFGEFLADIDLRGKHLLDAGSGGGHFSERACSLGAAVTSLDVGENVLEQVKRRCDSTRVVGTTLDLPFDEASFDVVLSTEVLEHTPDPKRGLRELARVVKPGGTLLVTTPGRLWQPVVWAASALKLRPYQGHENFMWPRAAQRVLTEADIEVEWLKGFNLLPLFHRRFDPVLRLTDRLGQATPFLYVNFALRGRKR